MRKKKTVQLKAIVPYEIWLKLRRMVEAGQIKGMIDGVTKAVKEFVEKYEKKEDDS